MSKKKKLSWPSPEKPEPVYELVELCGMLDQIADERLRRSIAFWLKELLHRLVPRKAKSYPTDQYERRGYHGD